jgi:hypothetical protein
MRSSARKLSAGAGVLASSSLWSAWAYAQDGAPAAPVVEHQRPVQTAPVTVPATAAPLIDLEASFGVGLRGTGPGQSASLLTVDAGLHDIVSGHDARLAAALQQSSLSQDGQNEPDQHGVDFRRSDSGVLKPS